MREPGDIDLYVGTRIRLRRTELGLTLVDLAERVGVAAQQVQKDETGRNRIAVARLVQIGDAPQTPIGWFLDGCPTLPATGMNERLDTLAGFIAMPEAVDIMRT